MQTHRGAIALLLLAAPLGCTGEPTEGDTGTCRQDFSEFGIYGCADIEGSVRGSDGQPLPRIDVVNGAGADASLFNTMPTVTDSTGRFRIRLIQVAPNPQERPPQVWVHAAVRPLPSEPGPSIRDSVLITLRVAGIGEVPTPTSVVITLPIARPAGP